MKEIDETSPEIKTGIVETIVPIPEDEELKG